MWTNKLGVAFFLFVFAMVLETSAVLAAPDLTVTSTGGIDGMAKEGKGMPVVVEISNAGDPFQGDLIVDFGNMHEAGTAKAIALDIGTGEKQAVRLTVDSANSYSFSQQQFRFFEGGWRNGKEVPYGGALRPNVNFYYTETSFAVMLSESGDRLSGLHDLDFSRTPESEVIGPLSKTDLLPPDIAGWGAVDLFIVDDGVLAALSDEEQEAIAGRVRAGATLLIGMTDDSADAGLFRDRLPFEVGGREELPPEAFRSLAGESVPGTPVPGFAAEKKGNARALAVWEDRILAAYSEYGAGRIVQTAFSFGDEPFAAAPGAADIIGNLLSGVSGSASAYSGVYGDPESDFIHLGQDATERFETFKIPVVLIIFSVALYIVLIGPVLYYVLKKKDKREQAWWIIPATAVLLSAGIFLYGAKDRLFHPQLRQAALFISDGSGSLSGMYTGSVLTNRSGNLSIEAPVPMTLSAAGGSFPFAGESGNFERSVAERTPEGTLLTLKNVPFWSVGTVHGQTKIEEAGSFESDLIVSEGKLTGTVTNGFPFRLKDVAIWSGTSFIELGDLESEETLEVDKEVSGGTLFPATSAGNTGMTSTAYGSNEDLRIGSMMEAAGAFLDGNRPAWIGHTTSPLAKLEVEGSPEYSSVSVIVQPFDPETRLSGPFHIPSSAISGPISPEQPNGYVEQYADGELFLSSGSFIYEPSVPEVYIKPEVEWTSVAVMVSEGAGVSVMNESSGEFEELVTGVNDLEEPADYIGPDGALQFRIEGRTEGGPASLPEIELKGSASP